MAWRKEKDAFHFPFGSSSREIVHDILRSSLWSTIPSEEKQKKITESIRQIGLWIVILPIGTQNIFELPK